MRASESALLAVRTRTVVVCLSQPRAIFAGGGEPSVLVLVAAASASSSVSSSDVSAAYYVADGLWTRCCSVVTP